MASVVGNQIRITADSIYEFIKYAEYIPIPTTIGTYTHTFSFPLNSSHTTGIFTGFVTYQTICG
jgi:hypothetical protein